MTAFTSLGLRVAALILASAHAVTPRSDDAQSIRSSELSPWLESFLVQKSDTREFFLEGKAASLRTQEVKDQSSSRSGLKLVVLTISANSYRIDVAIIRKQGVPATLLSDSSPPRDTFGIVNGGYFGTNDGSRFYPLGLLIHTGKMMNLRTKWTGGGMLLQTDDGRTKIVSVSRYLLERGVVEAVQSKPMLVAHSQSGIHSDDHELANRTAVGLRDNGDLVIAGAFNASGAALSLFEFADFLRYPATSGGAGVVDALNMDGGPGAVLICPPLDIRFGGDNHNYVPDGVIVGVRR